MALIDGTNNSETLDKYDGVTDFTDNIFGYGGNDTIYGLGGGDNIQGGEGADYIDGGAGLDWSSYADSTVGVRVSLATGTAVGGTAEGDTLVSIEQLWGSNFNDILVGDGGNNWLWGAGGNDTLKGGGGADTLTGAEGNDTLKGGGGADILQGDIGYDTAAYNEATSGVFVTLGGYNSYEGSGLTGDAAGDQLFDIENLTGSAYNDSLYGNNASNNLNGLDGADVLKGFGGVDSLSGGDDGDFLYGMDANDWLRGENGNDTLDGGAGGDIMIGGYGNDVYIVDSQFDIVLESGGQGNDEVRTSVSFTLTPGSDVETLRTDYNSGTAAIDLIGNSSGNIVWGNAGNNVIGGGDGNDELHGLAGQNSFLFDTALNAVTNVDVVTDFNVADDTILLDDDIFSSGLGLGNISSGEFVIGTQALDANDRIIYDSNTGALYYDIDCAGGNAAVQFATLSPGLALTYLDFLVVA